jgi:outer membrane protein
VLALVLVSGSYAQTFEGKKVGYLDISRVFDQYEKTKDFDKVLEGKHKEYESERNKKLEKIREAQNKLALLKDTEKGKLQSDIEQQRADLLEFDRQQQMDLRKQRDEIIREILQEAEKIVKDYAEKNGYVMIFNDRVLIFSDKGFDVTEEILKILNAGYKK